MYRVLIQVFIILIKIFKMAFKSKDDLILENLTLRQQLATYKINNVKPRIKDTDRAFWIAMKQAWSKWVDVLIIVKSETVIDWQRRRFKKHWTKISTQNKKPGCKRIKKEIRELIHRMHRVRHRCQVYILDKQL